MNGLQGTLTRNEQGQVIGLVLNYFHDAGAPYNVPLQRIDESTAQTIRANNKLRAQSQTPVPGSEAALRRLLQGLITRKPNYEEMAPWFAELVKETTYYNEEYVGRGAILSVDFDHVDMLGGDMYRVRQEGGFSSWIVWLNSNGVIEDADNSTR
jgi:hypothetical protein